MATGKRRVVRRERDVRCRVILVGTCLGEIIEYVCCYEGKVRS